MEVANLTHLTNARHALSNRSYTHFFGQEHSLPRTEWARARQAYKPENIHLSDLDAEADTPLGGICALRKDNRPYILPKPKAKNFNAINGKGRVQLYALDITDKLYILIYNIYGWTNAAKDKAAAARTNAMIEYILEDMAHRPQGPMMIVGDLNGDTQNFRAVQEALQTQELLDVGAHASKWGSTPADYTCKAPGARKPTRRDYILANPTAFDMIGHFHVDHQGLLQVHDILHLEFLPTDAHRTIYTVHKPKPLNDIILLTLKNRHGNSEHATQPPNTDNQLGQAQAQCPVAKQDPTTHTSNIDEQRPPCRNDFTPTQLEEIHTEITEWMDDYLHRQSAYLQAALDQGQHSDFLHTWTSCYEQAILQCTRTPEKDGEAYTGRSWPRVKKRTIPRSGTYDHTSKSMRTHTCHPNLTRLTLQLRRIQAIRDMARILAHPEGPDHEPSSKANNQSTPKWRNTAMTEIRHNVTKLVQSADMHNTPENNWSSSSSKETSPTSNYTTRQTKRLMTYKSRWNTKNRKLPRK